MFLFFRIIVVLVIISVTQFYFFRRIYKSATDIFPNIPVKKIKTILKLLALFFNLYPLLLIIGALIAWATNGSNFILVENEFVNYSLIYPFWIILTLMLQSLLYYVLGDIIRFVMFFLFREKKEITRKYFHKAVLLITAFFILYVPARVIYDLNVIEVNEYIYEKENLSAALEDFKIVLIADVQADQYTNNNRLQNYIDEVNSLNPDLVLIAGDVITSSAKYIDTAAEFIGKIKAENGVYACVGDHDNWAYGRDYQRSVSEIVEALGKYNVPMIDNDNKTIKVDSARIGMTFVTDNYVTRISPQRLDSLAAANHFDFKIFITHQPNQRMVDKAEEYSYNLFFAGHTHGGQISLSFPFQNLSATLFETKYVKGDFSFGDMMMIVNGGLGVSIAPVRYNSTADVSLITLKNKR